MLRVFVLPKLSLGFVVCVTMQHMHSQRKCAQMELVCSEELVHNFGLNAEDRSDLFKQHISFYKLEALSEALDLFWDLSSESTCFLEISSDLCSLTNNLLLFQSIPM